MKQLRSLYHFLGGVYFAILLIATVTLMVVGGTLIESGTGSHLYASSFTYNHPFFKTLLWLFFINILFAALRRWPFKKKHIPFLLVHLGLLMMLGGVLVKSYAGKQGSMSILEGSETNVITIAETYAIQIEHQGISELVEIKSNLFGQFPKKVFSKKFPGLEISINEVNAHSEEKKQLWIKDGALSILGLPPLPCYKSYTQSANLPLSAFCSLPFNAEQPWKIYAFISDNPYQLMQQVYLENAQLIVKRQNEELKKVSLNKAILENVNGIFPSFSCHYSPITGMEEAFLLISLEGLEQNVIKIPLFGPAALLNEYPSQTHSGDAQIDIKMPSTLIFIQDRKGDEYLFMLTCAGEILAEVFKVHNLKSLYVFNDGYLGYGVKSSFPWNCTANSRKELEEALFYRYSMESLSFLQNSNGPFHLVNQLQEAAQCIEADFTLFWMHFLKEWQNAGHWLYPHRCSDQTAPILEALQADHFDTQIVNGCLWIDEFFEFLEANWNPAQDLMQFLKEHQWPLLANLQNDFSNVVEKQEHKTLLLLTLLSKQLFSLGKHIAPPNSKSFSAMSAAERSRVITALLRLQGFNHDVLLEIETLEERQELLERYRKAKGDNSTRPKKEELFTQIRQIAIPLQGSKKWENNTPLITLKFTLDDKSELLKLSYNRFGTGLKSPFFQGKYLARFQALKHEIPYKVRLRSARQINYPNTQQAYSYESDLVFKPLSGEEIEKTISMNNVFESSEGYRFYMSNLSSADPLAIKRAEITVNYDPAKYILTYPGAFILTIGIMLLFWLRPYSKIR